MEETFSLTKVAPPAGEYYNRRRHAVIAAVMNGWVCIEQLTCEYIHWPWQPTEWWHRREIAELNQVYSSRFGVMPRQSRLIDIQTDIALNETPPFKFKTRCIAPIAHTLCNRLTL